MAAAIRVCVGSTNPIKLKAAESSFQALGLPVSVFAFKADPGISDWKSKHAIGQPFGARQTAYGAIRRMEECWQKTLPNFAVGFENGLVEIGGRWFDICFTAVRNGTSAIVKRGSGVLTEFEAPANATQEQFDESVLKYHQFIMPKIEKKVDLYDAWTANLPGGPKSREDFLSESLSASLVELKQLEKAKELIERCAEVGMAASYGPRYRYMLWTRDLAYMAPVYLQQGHGESLRAALRQIAAAQCRENTPYQNGYEQFNPFGKIPIVSVAPENQLSFLELRLEAWRKQLDYPESRPLESMESARKYYNELLTYREEQAPEKPRPSFALRHFMEGTLGDLTPGTRDSEIQFIRALFSLIDHEPQNKQEILAEFGEPLAHALNYLFKNVIKNDLPQGADSRDIFADILYDAQTLTNAIFLYSALKSLVAHANDLQKIGSTEFFAEKLHQVKESIQKNLLYENGQFNPRDFLPGVRAAIGLACPINPTPIDSIIKQDNPSFTQGRTVDPQSLAQAVLAGLIEPENYQEVIRLFTEADSPIGIRVFVPISGKTKEEADLLQAVKGEVVWPHVSWTIVRALIAMGTPEALTMAEEQRDKLMRFTGLGEWYAIDPATQRSIQGGDPEQGWSASSMILALNDFYDYYK